MRFYLMELRTSPAHVEITTAPDAARFKMIAMVTCDTLDESVELFKRQGWPRSVIANARAATLALEKVRRRAERSCG